MKKLFLILFILFLSSCEPKYIVIHNHKKIDCSKLPAVWYGNKGDDPSECDLWKCYNWELIKQGE